MTPNAIENAIAISLPLAVQPFVASERTLMDLTNSKIHFAIAIFHEVARLTAALRDFRSLGLSENDIWLACKTGSSLAHPDWPDGFGRTVVPVSTLPSNETLYGTDGPAYDVLQSAVGPTGKSCLQAILDGHIGALLDEASAGAVILIARTDDTARQDQSMRILLRHSLHMVYSRECLRKNKDQI